MRKKSFLVIIFAIIIVTSAVLVFKYRGFLDISEDKAPPVQKAKPESVRIESTGAIGSVVSINEEELVMRSGEEELTLDIKPAPSVYIMEGEERVEKKISDLKEGSIIKAYYFYNEASKVPIVIEIDKL